MEGEKEERKNLLHSIGAGGKGSFLRGDILISFLPVNVVARRLGKGQAGSVPQQHDHTRRVWPFLLENLD